MCSRCSVTDPFVDSGKIATFGCCYMQRIFGNPFQVVRFGAVFP